MKLEDRFAALADYYGDMHRILVCAPARTEQILRLVAAHDIGHLWTVRPSTLCPEDKLFLLDEIALRIAITDGFHTGPGIITYPPQETP